MMKRKLLLLFLITSMLFSAGCSKTVADSIVSKNSDESSDTKEDSSNTTKDSSDTPEEKQDEETEKENNSTPSQSKDESFEESPQSEVESTASENLYTVNVTKISDTKYQETTTDVLLDYSYDTLEILGNNYKKLQTSISDWQKEQDLYWQRVIEGESEQAKEASVSEDFYGYYLDSKLTVTRLDSQIFSFITEESRQTGAPYTTIFLKGVNFDASTGMNLSLKDVVIDYNSFSENAISYILEQLKLKEGLFMEYENYVTSSFDEIQWYFSAAGITLIYNVDEIAPNAAGPIKIILPSQQFNEQLKESYRTAPVLGYAQVPLEETFSFTTPSGENHTLKLYCELKTEEDGYQESIPYITLDQTTVPIFQEGWSSWLNERCYLIQQKGQRTLLAIELNYESDDYSTIFLDLTDGTVKVFATIDATIYIPGTEHMVLSSRIDALGTYSAIREYDISGKNGIVPLETESEILFVYHPLTTIKDLPVTTMDKQKIILPAGTMLTPIASDNESYIRVKDNSNNEEYRIDFTRNDYLIQIDGIDEYEYFEMLPYAG